jgi:O-antigen ligase
MLIPVFQDAKLKTWGLRAFAAGATAMLGLSYFEWLSGADIGLASSPNDYVIAKDRIIHSILMSLLVYFSAQEIVNGSHRWLAAILIALAAPNILFLVQGRTGYLLLGLLTVLFMSQSFGRRGLIAACLLVAATAWGAYTASETVQARVAQTITQIRNQYGYPKQHSWDPRLEYYDLTMTLIHRHPLLGTGTGSFSREYGELADELHLGKTTDPHNEYLHLATQAGLPAAGLFIVLLATQWYLTGRLPAWELRIGRGIVLAIAVGSLFNSLILSITGGLVWSYFSAIAFAGLSAKTAAATASEPAEDAAPPRLAA